jgi:hypothetical protein
MDHGILYAANNDIGTRNTHLTTVEYDKRKWEFISH